MTRDYNGLIKAKQKNWEYVWFNTDTGHIFNGDVVRPNVSVTGDKTAFATVDEYRWLTSDMTKIESKDLPITAGDWYAKLDFADILAVANVKC